jgi:hypothetical protein
MTNGQLAELKREFYQALLDDPVLTLLILGALDGVSASDLPDFTAEPWRPQPSNNGTQVLGIRFTRSLAQAADELDEVSACFGTFHYLEVLTISKERTEAPLIIGGANELFFDGATGLMELDTDDDMRRQAAMWFIQRWQEALRQAGALGAVIDMMTGTLTTEPVHYVQ